MKCESYLVVSICFFAYIIREVSEPDFEPESRQKCEFGVYFFLCRDYNEQDEANALLKLIPLDERITS